MASDQEGLAGQQMARMSGMQEVHGLDAAHEDQQTDGKENPVQDMKVLCLQSQLSLGSDLQKTLAFASSQAPKLEMSSGFLKTKVLFNTEKLK